MMSSLKIFLIAAAVCPQSLAVECADCAKGEDQTSLLQVHSEFSVGSERAERTHRARSPTQGCQTPVGATWCQVRMPGIAPYSMAVYAANCPLSRDICTSGRWEDMDPMSLGAAGEALDIGGHIGFFSFALAKAGWNVTTFEPMPQNRELFQATMCENPEVASKIKLLNVGLGEKPDLCQVLSANTNVGDGFTRCGSDAQQPVPAAYVLRGTFPIRRLDDVLAEQKIPKVNFVKIDVEGFECKVFKGAPEFLTTHRPGKIHTEVMHGPALQGCTPAEYLNIFSSKGYKIAKDEACKVEDPEPPTAEDVMKNYWVCTDA